MKPMPTPEQITAAKNEIKEEDRRAEEARRTPERLAAEAENYRRSSLPSEHPDHLCGLMCDGQDGSNSYCARLRFKLFGDQS